MAYKRETINQDSLSLEKAITLVIDNTYSNVNKLDK
jgi:hypothetical protein